jgi:hypothetical protein
MTNGNNTMASPQQHGGGDGNGIAPLPVHVDATPAPMMGGGGGGGGMDMFSGMSVNPSPSPTTTSAPVVDDAGGSAFDFVNGGEDDDGGGDIGGDDAGGSAFDFVGGGDDGGGGDGGGGGGGGGGDDGGSAFDFVGGDATADPPVAVDDAPPMQMPIDGGGGGGGGGGGVGGDDGSAFNFMDGGTDDPPVDFSTTTTTTTTTAAAAVDTMTTTPGASDGGDFNGSASRRTSASTAAARKSRGGSLGGMFGGMNLTGDGDAGDGGSPDHGKGSKKAVVPVSNLMSPETHVKAKQARVAAEASAVRERERLSMTTPALIASLRQQLADAHTQYWRQLRETTQAQRKLDNDAARLENELQTSASELTELEAKQAAAIEAEEYETADQMNTAMAAVRATLSTQSAALKVTGDGGEALHQKKADATQTLMSEVASLDARFAEQRQRVRNEKRAYLEGEAAALGELEERLAGDFERIARLLTHVSVDMKHVEEEETEIEASISSQTKDATVERDDLSQREVALQIAIDSLRAQLAEKEAELSTVEQGLRSAEARIEKVRDVHDRQIKRVYEKKTRIQVGSITLASVNHYLPLLSLRITHFPIPLFPSFSCITLPYFTIPYLTSL